MKLIITYFQIINLIYLITSCDLTHWYYNQETTLAIVKPEFANVNNMGIISSYIINQGSEEGQKLELINWRKEKLDKKRVEEFYEEHEGKGFFEDLVKYMISDEVYLFQLKGYKAISRWRNYIGSTDPEVDRKNNVNSLRALIGLDKTKNGFHGSDSLLSSVREIDLFY
ncbi:nucleoside diphosphate kinase [Neoconidiobolus thromboides FSU 785]|nr:nucleoside diphosphate kinase [Neoconidiobolus thromboides FSU 785]